MNEFYKLLVMFQKNERVTRSRLLRVPNITEDLLSQAESLGYIKECVPTVDGDVRYTITSKGIEKRDK